MPVAGFVLFPIATLLTALWHRYLFQRLVRDTETSGRWLKAGKYLFVGLWVLQVLGPFLFFSARSRATEQIAVLAWVWLGLSAFLTTLLLAVDALRLLGRKIAKTQVSPERRLFLSRGIAGAAAVATGAFGIRGVFGAYEPPEITELALPLPNLPRALDGIAIVQISDIHVGPLIHKAFLDDIVRRCNALRPDLMAITGDLVDGSLRRLGPEISAVSDLKSRFGTFFVTGNHEYYSGDIVWCRALQKMGIECLRNRTVRVGEPHANFDLVGVDDWRGNPHRRYDLGKAVQGRDPTRASVLLAHQPKNFDEVASRGIGLQLSGHTHGGQLFPMTLGIRLLWKRPVGLYKVGASHLYVHRGTGFWGPPMRVGSPPEIAKITLLAV